MKIIRADWVTVPKKKPEWNKKLPWAVEWWGGEHVDGSKRSHGISFFKLRRDARAFSFSICDEIEGLPIP